MNRTEMLERLERGEDPLELSIQKWEDIVNGVGEDEGRYNCALCYVYYDKDCKGCPVKERTGHDSCDGTPYRAWGRCRREHLMEKGNPCREIALQELDFLKSLRKEKE